MNPSQSDFSITRFTKRPALLSLLGTLALAVGCGPGQLETPNRDRALPVEALVAEVSEIAEIRRAATGLVEAGRRGDLGFELGGTLREALAQEGQEVQSGEVLARLDTRRLESGKREAEARVVEIEANLELARATLERTEKARTSEAVTAQALDEAKQRVASLEAGFAQAKARVESIDVDLEKSVLTAPYSGFVARRMADEGQVMTAGMPVFRLLEGGSKEVVIGTSEASAETLSPGDTVSLQIEGKPFSGVVEHLLPDRARRTRTVTARIRVEDPDNQLRDGALASAILATTLDQKGFWLPQTALTDNLRGLWAAYIVMETEGGPATVERVDLEILHTEGDRVYVRGGLRPGDRVVADGVQRLSPGTRVSVVKERNAEG